MNSFFPFLIILIIPFSYFSYYGIRVISLLPIFFIFIFLCNKKSIITISGDFILYMILLLIGLIYTLTTGDFLFKVPIFIFFLLTYWFLLLGRSQILQLDLKKLVRMYVASVLIFSIILLLQAAMFFNGHTFGKVEVFGGHRYAFYVNWTDSSFVSLYLASAVPLVFYAYKKNAVIIALIILFATILSSARTGITSLFLVLTFNLIIEFTKSMIKLKVKIKTIISMAILFVGTVLLIIFMKKIGLGRFGEGDNGRIQLMLTSINNIADNPFFGTMYSSTNTVGVHNFLLHIVSSGGFLFSIFFVFWLYMILKKARSTNIYIKYSIFTCILGMNFIPSFFSAYFLGFLISIMLINNLQERSVIPPDK